MTNATNDNYKDMSGDFITKQFVAGDWHAGSGGDRSITSPSSGAVLADVPDAGSAELDAAVEQARLAQPGWYDAGPLARANALREAARRLREQADFLARIDALDSGNPIKGMHFDVMLGATLVEYFAGLTTEAKGETIPQRDGRLTYTTREPLGVVARLVAFNHPLLFAAAKMAAPLAAGNSVIIKPSEETPLSALWLAEIVGDIFPKGVLSVLTGGAELGASICAHPGIAAVSLVGSVPTGKAVLKSAADSMKRTQLELGGKNALIICPDADLDAAINGAVKGMNLGWTAGQSCGSTSRILVHSSVYDAVVEGIEAAFSAVKLGDPLSQDTEMGSLSTASQFQRVTDYIASAKQQGATIRVGVAPDHDDNDTSSAHKDGFFVKPTLLVDVTSDMTIAREEVFGPVLSILQWDDEDEMIDIANGLDVGLTASIWTESLDTAMRLTGKIQAGYVWVNDSSDHYLGAPFGGMKSSGQGREECLEELLAYTEAKTVTIVQKNRS